MSAASPDPFWASSAEALFKMFSMAGASLFLPFLPLPPKPVLLTNLLTDLAAAWRARPRSAPP